MPLSTSLPVILGLFFALCARAQDLRTLLIKDGYNVSVVLPGEPEYANASQPFNLRYNFKPAAIAYPTNAHEVSEVVRFGEQVNHNVVPRSGGHSYIANGLGGKNGTIVIDLRNFNKIAVDNNAGTATIETGNRLGAVATALNAQGKALPHGTCAYVGFGGHGGYGGFGFTSRLWGLTIDAISSIDLVLANGTIATASTSSHPDLFWAMRGSAGSFGIATSITVRTFPAPKEATIFSYSWHLPAADAASLLAAFQNFSLTADVPPEVGAEIVLTKADVRGNVNVGLAGGWYAPIAGLNATLAPFFAKVPTPLSSSFDTGDYLHSAENLAGGSLDTSVPGGGGTDTFYARSLMTPSRQPIGDKAISALMDVVSTVGFDTPGWWFFQFELFGGGKSAINSVKSNDTAFVHRDSLFTVQFYSSAPGNVPPYPQTGFTLVDDSVNAIVANSPPGWEYGAYTNYADDRLPDWQHRYYRENYPRLVRLKKIYDPAHVFSFPTGIEN